MSYDENLEELGLVLPAPPKLPPGVKLPFEAIRVCDRIAYISGHIAQNPDGSLLAPFGKVGDSVSETQAIAAARATGLAMLGSLKRKLETLDNIECWISAFGMVNAAPRFNNFPKVINGFSDLILEVFGQEAGGHSRSAIGVGGLPFDAAVEIEAVVKIKG